MHDITFGSCCVRLEMESFETDHSKSYMPFDSFSCLIRTVARVKCVNADYMHGCRILHGLHPAPAPENDAAARHAGSLRGGPVATAERRGQRPRSTKMLRPDLLSSRSILKRVDARCAAAQLQMRHKLIVLEFRRTDDKCGPSPSVPRQSVYCNGRNSFRYYPSSSL